MADSASSPATLEPKPQNSESGAPNSHHTQSNPVPPSASPSPSPAPAASNPNPNPALLSAPPPPLPHPTISYAAAPPQVSGGLAFNPPAAPSFRPLPPQAPQFSPLPNPGGAPNLSYQNPLVQPPGVSSTSAMAPGFAGGSVAVPASVPPMQPMMSYQVPPGQPAIPALRPYAPLPNGYVPVPPHGTVPPAVS